MDNNTMNTSAQPQFQARPQMQSTTSAPVSYNQGGAKKSSSILIIVFLITTLGFAGAFAWAMLRGNGDTSADKTEAKCVVTQEQVDNPEKDTVAEVVANYDEEKEVKTLVDELVAHIDTKEDTIARQAQALTYNAGTVFTKLDDGNYALTSKSFGFMVTPAIADAVGPYMSATEEFLTSKGFTKNTDLSFEQRSVYDKDNIRCSYSLNSSPFLVACANTSWVDNSEKELVSALVKAYVAGGKEMDNGFITADADDIVTSSNGKYERIKATYGLINSITGSGYVLFYREVGATDWTFVTGGNGIPDCALFEGAAGEAFAGSGLGCATDAEVKNL